MTLKTFRPILNRIDVIIDGSINPSVGFIPDGLLFNKRSVVQIEIDVFHSLVQLPLIGSGHDGPIGPEDIDLPNPFVGNIIL
jgi:hypothetical protein